ncbi:MAG TPA: hypothetical protein VFV80_07325 [Geminicoccaceae bacterium]|nr:hypothetical protein [Geminicoccaceae bacterium]
MGAARQPLSRAMISHLKPMTFGSVELLSRHLRMPAAAVGRMDEADQAADTLGEEALIA